MLFKHFTTLYAITKPEETEEGKLRNSSIFIIWNPKGLDAIEYENDVLPFLTISDKCKYGTDYYLEKIDESSVLFTSYCSYTIDFPIFLKDVGKKPEDMGNLVDCDYTHYWGSFYWREDVNLGAIKSVSYNVDTDLYTFDMEEESYFFGLLNKTQAIVIGSVVGVIILILIIFCSSRCCCGKENPRGQPISSNQMMMAPTIAQPAPSFNPQPQPQQFGMQGPYGC